MSDSTKTSRSTKSSKTKAPKEPKIIKEIKESLFKKKEDKEEKDENNTKIVLEEINRTKLEKNYITNEDILMSSLRNSPKSKKMTKIKDIFNKSSEKEFSIKEKKNYIRETDNIIFYLSMNGEMVNMRNLSEKPVRCFHCHTTMNGIPLSVPIKFHETVKVSNGIKTNKFFEEKNNDMTYISKCYTKEDKEHPLAVKKDYFECIGAVCSFECAVTHAKMRTNCGDVRFKNSYFLIAKMYHMIHKKPMPKLIEKPMFCYELLEDYGGMCKEVPLNITGSYFSINDASSINTPTFKISSCVYQELKK
jgi:hypothetical protein